METNGALLWNIQKYVSKGDYMYAVVKEHPYSTKYGYVLAHRIIMENHLGRLLNRNEVIHHTNDNKKDNRIENLQLMTASEHTKLHQSVKGRTMLLLKCPECGNKFSLEKRLSFIAKKTRYNTCSNSCRGKFSRKEQLHGLTQEMKKAISENLLLEYNSKDNSEVTDLHQEP